MSDRADDGPEKLYRDTVRAHARAPRGRDREIAATHRAEGDNPLCGDRVEITLRVEDGVITDAAFRGEGCAICLASASLLCTHLPGEAAGAVAGQLQLFQSAVESDGGKPNQLPAHTANACPPALAPLLPVAAWPARIDCATLPWQAAVTALAAGAE